MIVKLDTEKFGAVDLPVDFPATLADAVGQYGEAAVFAAVESHFSDKVRNAVRGRLRIADVTKDDLIKVAHSVVLEAPISKGAAKAAAKLDSVVSEASDAELDEALSAMSDEARDKLIAKLTAAAAVH